MPIHNPILFRAVQIVYFTIPVIGGVYIMQWAADQSEANLGKNREKLRKLKEERTSGSDKKIN